jgi:hypothetical protein
MPGPGEVGRFIPFEPGTLRRRRRSSRYYVDINSKNQAKNLRIAVGRIPPASGAPLVREKHLYTSSQ